MKRERRKVKEGELAKSRRISEPGNELTLSIPMAKAMVAQTTPFAELMKSFCSTFLFSASIPPW